MSVAGIDFSTKAIHIVTLAEDTNHADLHIVRLDLQRGGYFDRVRRLRDLMPARTAWADAGVTLLAVERPYSHNASTLAPMMLAYGALTACIPPDMPWLELRANEWRDECKLPKRGDDVKRAAIRYARQCWTNPPDTLDDNAADAFCIAWCAREIDIRNGHLSKTAA